MSEQAQSAVGTQLPHVRPPFARRFSITHGGRNMRTWSRYTQARAQRPILTFLVTHRRRFTTGHKHKQPYQG